LAALPVSQNPLKKALAYKDDGNKYFMTGKYAGAVKCYDNAIEICICICSFIAACMTYVTSF